MSKSVAILQPDRDCAESLANKLRTCFHPVLTTRSVEELRETASRFRIDVGIVDLATVPASEIILYVSSWESKSSARTD